MGDFDGILQLTIGGAALDAMQLLDYAKSAERVVDEKYNVVGTKITYDCQAELVADDTTDLIAAVAALNAWAVNNASVAITVGGTIIEQLLAADVLSGIHVTHSLTDQDGPGVRLFKVSITGTVAAASGVISIVEKVATRVNLEGLVAVTRAGHVRTSAGTSAGSQVAGQVGACPDLYQLTYSYDANEHDTEATYQVQYAAAGDGLPGCGQRP